MASYPLEDNDEVVSGCVRNGGHLRDRRDPLLFSVLRFIEKFNGQLDAKHFPVMRLTSDVREICNVPFGRLQYTSVDACIKRWWHWGGSRVTDSLCYYPGMGSPYIRFFEEVGYELCFGEIIRWQSCVHCSYWL